VLYARAPVADTSHIADSPAKTAYWSLDITLASSLVCIVQKDSPAIQ